MNWQNVPRDDKTIKRAVLPKRGALVFADYKQVEPRLTAYFLEKIGHPEFADQIRAGVGPYEAVARLATGKESLTEQERDVWKRVFLGILYGAGAPRIKDTWAEETGEVISFQQAKNIVDTFKRNWPAIPALQNEVIAVHNDRGYIQTPWGRQLHAEENGEHKLLNKLIQGSAADLMKHAILKVDEGLRSMDLEARMVSVIHDELILDAPLDEVKLLSKTVPAWMSIPATEVGINQIVPITADVEVSSTSWADKTDYTEWKEILDQPQAVHVHGDAG